MPVGGANLGRSEVDKVAFWGMRGRFCGPVALLIPGAYLAG